LTRPWGGVGNVRIEIRAKFDYWGFQGAGCAFGPFFSTTRTGKRGVRAMLQLVDVHARDLPDAWFQCVYEILERGRRYTVERGSYEGQQRLEFDYITVQIRFPSTRPLLPTIPAQLGIPDPVESGYLEEYLPYLMTSEKHPNEDYTYGSYLEPQINEVIRMYREDGHNTNQAYMTVGEPKAIYLKDPPCLRGVDTRIHQGKLHFMVYFRSWDLWNGFPANLGALQMLKEYMADAIGVADGEIIAASKGLHLYDYVWELAELRAQRSDLDTSAKK